MTKSKQPRNPEPFSRRKFLQLGIGTASAVIGLSYVGLIGNFLAPPAASAEGQLQEVGKIGDFPENTPTLVSYKGSGVEEGVYVVNLGAQEFIALDFHCTHLECAVNWVQASKQFICPCHGGVYDIKGTALAGPPPKPLTRRVVKVDGDSVQIGGRLA